VSFRSLCVVGLGRIGLPMSVVIAEHGLQVFGVDANAVSVVTINAGDAPFLSQRWRSMSKESWNLLRKRRGSSCSHMKRMTHDLLEWFARARQLLVTLCGRSSLLWGSPSSRTLTCCRKSWPICPMWSSHHMKTLYARHVLSCCLWTMTSFVPGRSCLTAWPWLTCAERGTRLRARRRQASG